MVGGGGVEFFRSQLKVRMSTPVTCHVSRDSLQRGRSRRVTNRAVAIFCYPVGPRGSLRLKP